MLKKRIEEQRWKGRRRKKRKKERKTVETDGQTTVRVVRTAPNGGYYITFGRRKGMKKERRWEIEAAGAYRKVGNSSHFL